MSKVRIASVIKRLHFGGDETRLLSFARHLDRERFDHRVIVVQSVEEDPGRQTGPMLAAFQDAGVDVVVLGRDIVSVTATPAPVSAGPVRRLVRTSPSAAAVLRQASSTIVPRVPPARRGRPAELRDGLRSRRRARLVGAPGRRLHRVLRRALAPSSRSSNRSGSWPSTQVDAFITDAEATLTEVRAAGGGASAPGWW